MALVHSPEIDCDKRRATSHRRVLYFRRIVFGGPGGTCGVCLDRSISPSSTFRSPVPTAFVHRSGCERDGDPFARDDQHVRLFARVGHLEGARRSVYANQRRPIPPIGVNIPRVARPLGELESRTIIQEYRHRVRMSSVCNTCSALPLVICARSTQELASLWIRSRRYRWSSPQFP